MYAHIISVPEIITFLGVGFFFVFAHVTTSNTLSYVSSNTSVGC